MRLSKAVILCALITKSTDDEVALGVFRADLLTSGLVRSYRSSPSVEEPSMKANVAGLKSKYFYK